MEETEEMRELLGKTECYFARCCRTNGYGGHRYYRYPATYYKGYEEYKVSGNYYVSYPKEIMPSVHYNFGSHKLYIGKAIMKIYNFLLNERSIYDLDFDEYYNPAFDKSEYVLSGKTQLILVLEYFVATSYGNNYRYPLTFKEYGSEYVLKGDGYANVPEESIDSMYYSFGAHEFHVGKALSILLDKLEQDYYYISDIF